MSYRQLLANLEALPEEERQLASGVYFFEEDGKRVCGCVLGKGLPEMRAYFETHFETGNDYSITSVLEHDGRLPEYIARSEARRAQSKNDQFRLQIPYIDGGPLIDNEPATRRARYVHMIEWLRARVAEESEAPQAPKSVP